MINDVTTAALSWEKQKVWIGVQGASVLDVQRASVLFAIGSQIVHLKLSTYTDDHVINCDCWFMVSIIDGYNVTVSNVYCNVISIELVFARDNHLVLSNNVDFNREEFHALIDYICTN